MSNGDNGPAISSAAVGLCLLPSELLQEIFFRLALPELLRLRSVSKDLGSLVAGGDFRRLYDHRSGRGGGWLFVYKKRPPRYSVLRGFNDRSGRWFHFPVAGILSSAVPPGEDLYFLAASGGFFLFASNGRRELVAVNLATRAVRRLPPSPLGPRGTSSWRRSGLKLVADPSRADRFRFLFAEMVNNRPVLFEYRSDSDTWHPVEATVGHTEDGGGGAADGREICLNLVQLGRESVVLSCAGWGEGGEALPAPVAHRPRFPEGFEGGPPVGLTTSDRFHMYGDGNMVLVRSGAAAAEEASGRARVVTGVELMGLSSGGGEWELTSTAPPAVVAEALRRRPYGVMMGCVVEREGVVRVVLMSNCRGSWDLAWLSYHRAHRKWACVPVPDCGTKGLNMAGIALSSTFSRSLWPSSSSSSSSASNYLIN